LTCPSCGHDNRETARFCEACGSALGQRCRACHAALRVGARFCDNCGAELAPSGPAPPPPTSARPPEHLTEKLRDARSAVVGERKQVTVLFADVQGSMEFLGELDPDDWRALMDRFVSIMAAGIHRFEGTVDKFTGDGVMALFGAPLTHEDHALRACLAALHLRDELASYAAQLRRERGLSFAVRMGLNSGEVIVGAVGEDLSLRYTAVGQTVGLAARIESLAEPGKAYLTERTAALVKGNFELADLGEFPIKGIARPVRVHELQGIGPRQTPASLSAARGLSRFVGRDEAIAELEGAGLHAAAGEGQVVGIVGEAGIGKSRLCHEFAQSWRSRGLPVYEAHGLAHREAVPNLPILELLRGRFGLRNSEDDAAVRAKVAGRLVLRDESFRDLLPLVFDFLGVSDPALPAPPVPPDTRRRQLLGVLDQLLLARSAEAPAVHLIEDLDRLDDGTHELLAGLVDGLPTTRTLLLVTFRPGYRAAWMERSYFTQISLRPLGPDAASELLTDLLGSDPSLDQVAKLVASRGEGNPFFLEELVRTLVEKGNLDGSRGAYVLARQVDEMAIPETVEAVLAARIDRLAEREKTTLQTAAVIGRGFSEPLLRRVCGVSEREATASLRALVAGEFVLQRALYPQAEYMFKHALTQEVAYRSLLRARRAQLHAAVARAIQEVEQDRLAQDAALVAHHWEAAGDSQEAERWRARAAATADPGSD
jgi:class 3 adenylate cyclase